MAESIPVVVVDRDPGTVDWDLFKVRTTIAVQLSIEVGENTSLKQWIFSKVNTTDDVARLKLWLLVRGYLKSTKPTYHDLLGLGKVIYRVAVELHFSEWGNRDIFNWKNLGWIQQVKSVA